MSENLNGVVAHPLRRLLIASFLVSIPLSIVVGLRQCGPLPAVGLVPLGLSAFLALCFRNLWRLGDSGKARGWIWNTAVVAFASDVLAITALLVILILTWTKDTYSWRWSSGRVMLMAYATVPMLFNLFVQFYLALLMLYHAVGIHALLSRLFATSPATCPHCHEHLQPSYSRHFSFARGAYQPVEVRPEHRFHDDDEAADALLDPSRDTADAAEVSKGKGKETETV